MATKIKVTNSTGVQMTIISDKSERCTIGYRRVNNMIQVAVSYCAKADKWNRKTGRKIVEERLSNAKEWDTFDRVISVPNNKMWDEEHTQSVLKNMFFGFRNPEF